MLRFPAWKVAVILGICVIGGLLSVPNLFSRDQLQRLPDWLPHEQINLGLDLQGGSHLLLEVDLHAVVEERLNTLVDDIRGILRPARIGYRGLGVHGDAATLTLTDPADSARALELLKGLNPNPLSKEVELVAGDGGRIDVRPSAKTIRDLAGCRGPPVARDRAPADRRDRHPGAHHPAPGRRPDPGPGAGREGPGKHQAPARPDRQADLPSGRSGHALAAGAGRQPAARVRGAAEHRARRRQPGRGPQADRGQRREPDRRPADLPAEPARGELPLRFGRRPQVRRRDPRPRRRAAGDRARRQGDQLAAHPGADPGRQRGHLGQLHRSSRPTSSRSCCAPAPCRRRSRSSRSARSGPTSAPIRSARARSRASWP